MEPFGTLKFVLKEEVKLEDGNVKDLLVKPIIFKKQLVKRRRTGVSGSTSGVKIEVFDEMENKASDGLPVEDSAGKDPMDVLTSCAVQNSVKIEVFDMESKASDGLPVEDSAGKDPMDVLTSCAVQNSGQANGCSNGLAISNLLLLCKRIHCKEPSFDFEEQGPEHMKIFKCKVTIHLVGLSSTAVECFSNPKPNKKAAQEDAAQGAIWFLKRTILQG